jgi:hypothetical protein
MNGQTQLEIMLQSKAFGNDGLRQQRSQFANCLTIKELPTPHHPKLFDYQCVAIPQLDYQRITDFERFPSLRLRSRKQSGVFSARKGESTKARKGLFQLHREAQSFFYRKGRKVPPPAPSKGGELRKGRKENSCRRYATIIRLGCIPTACRGSLLQSFFYQYIIPTGYDFRKFYLFFFILTI